MSEDLRSVTFPTRKRDGDWLGVPRSVLSGTIERTIDGASSVTVQIRDPDRAVLKSQSFDVDENGKIDVPGPSVFFGREFQLVGISKQGEQIEVVWEDYVTARMRELNAIRKARRGDVSRPGFVRSLVPKGVPVNIPELGQPITYAKRPRREREVVEKAEKNPGLDRDARITVKGLRATPKQLHAIELAMSVADDTGVDRRVVKAMLLGGIAEGQFIVDRYNMSGSGAKNPWQVLASTARALGIPRDNSDTEILKSARAFLVGINGQGFRGVGYDARSLYRAHPSWSAAQIAATVEGAGAGTGFYSEWEAEAENILAAWGGGTVKTQRGGTVTYERDYYFTVGRPKGPRGENYWEASGRLAEEVGRRRFVVDGEFWYISEEDLFARAVGLTISEDDDGIESIDFDLDNGKKVKECTVPCRIDKWSGVPGGLVRVKGMGPADGKWLITAIREDLFSPAATVTLRKPIKERPEPRGELVTKSVAANEGNQTRGEWKDLEGSLREKVVRIAKDTMTSRTGFRRYSQAGALTADPTPAAPLRSDCSQWARAVYLQAGGPDPGTWTGQQVMRGKPVQNPRPGDLVFPRSNSHVELYIGNGQTIGHGTAPIDHWSIDGMRSYFGGVHFRSYLGDD